LLSAIASSVGIGTRHARVTSYAERNECARSDGNGFVAVAFAGAALRKAGGSVERQMLELKFSANDVGYAFMAPPETPAERVAALRAAMTAAVNDPAFRADALREKIEVDPVAGAEVEAIIRNAYAASPEVLTRLNDAIKPPR